MSSLETSSRPYLLTYGAPSHPDITVRYSFANKDIYEDITSFSGRAAINDAFVEKLDGFPGKLP